MRTVLKVKLSLLSLSCVLMAACSDAPKGDKAKISQEQQSTTTAGGEVFTVDTAKSLVRFTGHGVGKNHPGRFKLSYGTVSVANNQISGGQFEIDIQSLEVDQQEEMFQTKLKPHLLSGDFFDVQKFGSAKFEITKVEPYKPDSKDTSLVKGANFNISGNLTLKGTTKNVTFPARVDLDGDNLEAVADFDIDRRQWQMNYGNDKTLGDKFISETVNIKLDLKASKD